VPRLVSDNLVFVVRCDVVEVAFISETKKTIPTPTIMRPIPTDAKGDTDRSRLIPGVFPTDPVSDPDRSRLIPRVIPNDPGSDPE